MSSRIRRFSWLDSSFLKADVVTRSALGFQALSASLSIVLPPFANFRTSVHLKARIQTIRNPSLRPGSEVYSETGEPA